jgi:RHS repeat-associated protein
VERYAIDRNQITFVTDEAGNETFHYLYGLNVDQVLAQDSPTGMVWSLSDRLGSINLLTDASGNVVDKRTFDSFGNLLEQTNPLVAFRYGYTGREFDAESGLHFYRARYYDPGIGRFISVDPMGFEAGDTNLYRYVFNSPTQWVDPSGEIVPLLLGVLYATLAGAAVGAVVGATYGVTFGAAYGLADHFEHGGGWDNINWGNIGEKAAIGGVHGAIGGAVVGATLGGLSGFALAAGLATSTVIGANMAVGAGFSGWQIGTGINNIFVNDKPVTGAVDILGGIIGIAITAKGYGPYKKARTQEAEIAAAKAMTNAKANTKALLLMVRAKYKEIKELPRESKVNCIGVAQ